MKKAFGIAVGISLWLIALFPCVGMSQFEPDEKHNGPVLDKQPLVQKLKVGINVTAVGGPCKGIRGTAPVPTDWPEQRVRILEEKTTPNVRAITYKTLAGGVKQMVVDVPALKSGESASAHVIFEITRSALVAPEQTSELKIPEKPGKDLVPFLGISPYIETKHPKIVALAKEAGTDKQGWEKVEAIYDLVREKIEYKTGELKGALRALNDGTGDCEELSALFIALCRNNGIPARTVWVQGHCYPEFYLTDANGKRGYWFPCQAAGTRSFGGISEQRPIIQKGDNFRDPDRPKEKLRYVNEFLKGAAIKGGGDPQVDFIRELIE